ncbi:hypothetical protein [Stenotrophomonas maltophilia]|uniref:hypothetical protein n=1 Tax=Stenotrophomonas maltophilia TaxID=40324 RepID=UPI0015F566F1|nr:hypothetical protein [Stenotrophomonas maltophilia]
MKREAVVQEWMRQGFNPDAPPIPVVSTVPAPTAPPATATSKSAPPEAVMWVGKAITQWLTDIKKGTVPKSLVYKRLALESFARAVGETTPVHE